MRVLLDECVDIRLVENIAEVDVTTVAAQGWGGVSNGQLLALSRSVMATRTVLRSAGTAIRSTVPAATIRSTSRVTPLVVRWTSEQSAPTGRLSSGA